MNTTPARVPDRSADSRNLFGLSTPALWLMLFLAWTLLAVIQAIRLYYLYNFENAGFMTFGRTLALAMTNWYIWAALSPLIYYAATRFEIDRENWRSRLFIHFLLAGGFGLLRVSLHSVLFHNVRHWFDIPVARSVPNLADVWPYMLRSDLLPDLMTYLLIAFGSLAVNYYGRLRNEQQRVAEAEARLADARLATLRGQLQPHFLFNTLNAITALIHIDPQAADRMIARLSDLLRMTLDLETTQTTTLRQEIQFVECYLEIQYTRFRDRLRTEMAIPTPLLDAEVPPLILQPIVENAIRHGIAPRSTPGTVYLFAAADHGRLILTIIDDGAGLDPDWEVRRSTGLGVRNTRDRLAALYGTEQSFDIATNDYGGVTVTISLPLRGVASEHTV